jgi:ACT domain-containing protein
MAKRGRKNAYETVIKPRFDDILKWLRSGATEEQICKNLGISQQTFYKYKQENTEFSEFLIKGRQNLVEQLRGALIKKALGFDYAESKVTTKVVDGKEQTTTEITTKAALPDVAALNLCLKNYDPENWANDPQALKLKEKELELKQKIAEKDIWDGDF